MWMACSAIGRSTIGRWKLMMIGLPTPTMEPLVGLKDGGRNTGSPVYGVGFWPAGVPSGMVVGRAANGSAGAAGAGAGVDRRRERVYGAGGRRGQRIRRRRDLGGATRGRRRRDDRCGGVDRSLRHRRLGGRARLRTERIRSRFGIGECQGATEHHSSGQTSRDRRGHNLPHSALRHAYTSSQSCDQSRTARGPANAVEGFPNPDSCPENDAELLCSSGRGVECYFLLVTWTNSEQATGGRNGAEGDGLCCAAST